METYGLVVDSFDSDRYVIIMDEQARQAKLKLEQTGRIWVIVQDNGSAHTSKLVLS